MADNVLITAGAGTAIAADELVDGTLGTVKVQYVKLMDGTLDGTTKATVGATGLAVASTNLAGSAVIGKVGIDQTTPGTTNAVALSAETTKVIGTVNVSAAQNITPVDQYGTHKEAAASATTLLGAAGAVGDYLAGVVIVPGTAAAGTVGMTDGNGATISLFAGGGVTPLPSLVPFFVPLGIFAVNATTAGWRLILGANVTAIAVGKFT